jgi:hypothetical protein
VSVAPGIRESVRLRAEQACEFCSVTETDAGGLLTIDHFQPTTKGGSDEPVNLLYCCVRCNQYKASYWPVTSEAPTLWNPRTMARADHFVELPDARLHPLTLTGAFTLQRLRLNRPPLVDWRLRRNRFAEEARLLATYRDLVEILNQLHQQEARLLEEQQAMLAEQQAMLRRLLRGG